MVRQDKLKILPFLLEDEEKFNKGWHWPLRVAEKVLATANSINSGNKRGSGPQSGAPYHSNTRVTAVQGEGQMCFSCMGLSCAASAYNQRFLYVAVFFL